MKISLIAAMTENRVISRKNKIPWKISGELLRFREITEGHTIIMGSKTYESIGNALPERTNIVITSQKDYRAPNCIIAESFEDALNKCEGKDVFVIGGEQVFIQALPFADKIYLSVIHDDFDGDRFFPDFSDDEFQKVYSEDVEDRISYTLNVYERSKIGSKLGLRPFGQFNNSDK